MKYKKISEIVPEINDFVKTYAIAITETKKSSFTAQFTFPIHQKNIDLFIEISSETLLPINLSFNLDAILIEHLKKEYIEKYLTESVDINKASFELNVKLSYGNYTITELSDAEKEEYTYLKKINLQ
ncbi:MAG: hypothetical protein K2I42_00750 [Anaeroplasmataceae bacterium]|nr:hypothetical protein [Anaeroplasmataceae bacterium]